MLPTLSALALLVERLLDRLFGHPGTVRGRLTAGSPSSAIPPLPTPLVTRMERAEPPDRDPRPLLRGARCGRAILTVDDAGQYLVVAGRAVTLGHRKGGAADLPFLADVGRAHARLERSEGLGIGSAWALSPVGGERVYRNGERLHGSALVADGDVVKLGGNLSFRFREPDPASSSALLDLLHGAECLGAAHALLLVEGPGGRVRIGSGARCHVPVAGLRHGISLVLEGERLAVCCEGGVGGEGEPARGTFTLGFPPPRRVDLAVGEPGAGGPPFGLSLAPPEDPERAGGTGG